VNRFGELKDKGIAVFEELVDELVGEAWILRNAHHPIK